MFSYKKKFLEKAFLERGETDNNYTEGQSFFFSFFEDGQQDFFKNMILKIWL